MTLIRRLRLHIIIGMVSVLMVILAILLVLLNASLLYRENREIDRILETLVENGGHPPELQKMRSHGQNVAAADAASDSSKHPQVQTAQEKMVPAFFRTLLMPVKLEPIGFRSFFSLLVKPDGSIEQVSRHLPMFETEDALQNLVQEILASNKAKGFYAPFSYRLRMQEDGNQLLVLLDCKGEVSTFQHLVHYSFLVWIFSLLATFLLSVLLSGVIVRPVADSIDRQKNFISDAGHELKTPIAVIAANVDVLLPDMPNNRWLQYIKAETERMNRLVKDLLFLARDDAGRFVMQLATFDLSNAIENAVLPFESIIFEQGKMLECSVQKQMECTGDEQQIKQVVVILVDNAIKNSEKGALIRVQAYTEAQRKVIRVYNTGHGIADSEMKKIFLRFYRSDASRARKTGGYGLGLAIAKTISDAHGGNLSVASKLGEWAEFTFVLP